MRKGGRIKRAQGRKWLVQRHGKGEKRSADREEKIIETRERRRGREEIAEALREMREEDR